MTIELMSAPLTPFLENGDLDLAGAKTLLKAIKASGIDSAIVPGTTGEFTALSDEERNALVACALEVFGPEGVYAHVGAATARQAVALARAAKALGAVRFAAITPYYVTAGPQSVTDYFRQLTEAVPGDEVYVYVFPARATTEVSPDTLASLATIPGVAGAKISGLPIERVLEYLAAAPDGFRVFAGNDADIVRLAAAGAAGVVSGISGVFPEPFVAAAAAIDAGEDATVYQAAIDRAAAAVAGGDIGLLKAGSARRGLPAGPLRVALEPATDEQLAVLDEAVRRAPLTRLPLRKIINDPSTFVDETLNGIVLAHPESYRFVSRDHRAVARRTPGRDGQVGIVTGGGSGHLPLFLGYVGDGLASAVAVGNVFSSPSAEQIRRATEAAEAGGGVLYLYGNYGGDIYNFDLAAQLVELNGIRTRTVLGADDVMSAPAEQASTRRGVAGLVFAYKTAGAAAERGDDLDTVARIARRTVDATRTAGVGLSPTILPAAGRPTFTIDEGEAEIGVGIHGERGRARIPIPSADAIAETLVEAVDAELALGSGDRVAILVNGLGATPLEELYLLYGRAAELIAATGARIAWNFIGEYTTSLEMAGASISILRLDAELEELIAAPASSPFFRPGTAVTEGADDATAVIDEGTSDPSAVAEGDAVSAVRAALLTLAGAMPAHADELRELDALTGDGDLGITVESGAHAIRAAVEALPERAMTSTLLARAGLAFASANPSTFAALVGSAMLAASRIVDDTAPVTRSEALRIGRAIAAAIAERGGAALGDKTLLDMLIPALDELEARPDLTAEEFDAFLSERAAAIAGLRAARGRAAWQQERSIGQQDPGAIAIAHALSALMRPIG